MDCGLICLLLLLPHISAFNGFSNLDLETAATRALRITDATSDIGTIQPDQSSPPLRLYSQLEFTWDLNNDISAQLFYASKNTDTNLPLSHLNTRDECSSNNFVLGVWREVNDTYRKILDFSLEQCANILVSGFVCCELTIPSEVNSGDILGIQHSDQSSLLHNFIPTPGPIFEVLVGEEKGGMFNSARQNEDLYNVQRGFPLLILKPNMISGLLTPNLLGNLFTTLTPGSGAPIGGNVRFSCSGRIGTWYFGGISTGSSGNILTVTHFTTSAGILHIVQRVTLRFEDIVATDNPNIFKTSSLASQFEFTNGDFVIVTHIPTSQFTVYHTSEENPEALNGVQSSSISDTGIVRDVPLLSFQVSDGDCGEKSLIYDPNSLVNRALLIQSITFPPLSDAANLRTSVRDGRVLGYLYLFPNITFSEGGSIFQWRFAARVNTNVSSSVELEFPSLQVWRQNFSLVSCSDASVEPNLVLGTLNLYSYEVNLTYEAGDFIAVYQPPIRRSKYLLTFVDSSSFRVPNTAYEREVLSTSLGQRLDSISTNDQLLSVLNVEPVISILSTSMPNDTLSTTLTLNAIPVDRMTRSTDSVTTFPMLSSSLATEGAQATNRLSQTAIIATIGGVVGGVVTVLLLIIVSLVLALCCVRHRYKKSDINLVKRTTEENSGYTENIDSASYAVIRSTPSDNNLHAVYHSVQAYEVPMATPLMSRLEQEILAPTAKPSPYTYARNGHQLLNHMHTNSGNGLLVSHNPDNTARDNDERRMITTDTAQPYEVPSVSKDAFGMGTNKDCGSKKPLEHSSVRADDVDAYEEEPYEDAFYVPTQSERINFNSIENIYYSLRESQLPTRTSGDAFFEESDEYWAPASDTSELYDQMATRKYREISRNQIQQTKCLGSGQFGTVFKGVWKCSSNINKVDVAIKILKNDVQEKEKLKFLQEGAINGQFQHPNVVKLYGMVTVGEPVMIILEFLLNGDLCQFLNNNRSNLKGSSKLPQLLLGFCQDVATGMDYLSKKGFVHRDLAARNILLTENQTCKITDFGMSRDLEEDNYYISHGGMIPIRWTAPEALSFRKYSTASDVWSFGVLMYEIWSVGHKPFSNYENIQVVKLVRNGHRLKPPSGCPREIYRMMMNCWNPESSSRPTFSGLLQTLFKMESELLPKWNGYGGVSRAARLGDLPENGKNLHTDLQPIYLSHQFN